MPLSARCAKALQRSRRSTRSPSSDDVWINMALPFQHLWRRLWQDPPPTLACEFSEDSIAVAGWSLGATQPDSFAMRPLPPGALRPSPVRENINAPQEVAAA